MATKNEQGAEWDNNDDHYKMAILLAILLAIPTVEAKKVENSAPIETSASQKEQPSAATMFNAYANSEYHYGDAVLLAKLWKTSVIEAKHAIGRKVINHIEDSLPTEVQALHKEHLNESDNHAKEKDAEALYNAYINSDYHYDDAALLAKLWKISVVEAKQTIGHKITHQIEDLLPTAVKALHKKHLNAGDHHATENNTDALFRAYVSSEYHYDDAVLLAKLWKTSVIEAKHAIGRKVTNQTENLLPAEVQALHKEHLNAKKNDANTMFTAYVNSDYHYDDAALLAKLWKISVMEAKQAIGRKVTSQIEDLLPAEVQALHKKHLNAG